MQGCFEFGDKLYFVERGPERTYLQIELKEILCRRKSKFQQIDVALSYDFGKLLILDGCLMLTERDECIYHEMISHVPILLHPDPRSVLIIGGGDGGTVREVLRHKNVRRIDLVEIDQEVTNVCKEYFPQLTAGLNNARVSLRFEDGVEFVKHSSPQTYDVIILDSSDPVGPAEGLFTEEFYKNCHKILTPDGVLVAQSESPYVYPEVVNQIYNLFTKIFKTAYPYRIPIPTYASGQLCFMFGSKKNFDKSVFGKNEIIKFFKKQSKNLKYLNNSVLYSVFNNASDILRMDHSKG